MAAISTIAAGIGAAATAVGAYTTYEQGKAAKDAARKSDEAAAQLAKNDPALERAKAEQDAAIAANSKLAARNKARQASSLLAKDSGEGLSVLSGKTKLGQ
jgi:hypothetical protein